jgi:transglutaminase-like putative cysteine protease
MLFHVVHQSLYRYDVPVRLADHLLRLTPRPDAYQLLWQTIDVDPLPYTRSNQTDAEGNSVTRLSFLGQTQRLRVESRFELRTFAPPPLLFDTSLLSPAQTTRAHHPDVLSFAQRLAHDVNYAPVLFLDHLCHTLFTTLHGHARYGGAARAAHETLAIGSGACRDLAVLFLDTCRVFNLEGRFVSGYQAYAQTPDSQHQLHAWAEVLLPGAGFCGWDPMHGVRVGEGHVALYAARMQADTMPIEGGFSFEGSSVNSTLDHHVQISTN